MRIVRVAICQLESHPALYSGHIAFPEEPFFPTDTGSLSRLGAKGIDVQALQNHCRTEYVRWARARVASLLDFISGLNPPPDLVLFPEGGVPLEALASLRSWSAANGATVLAGTHTPLSTPAALRCYNELAIGANQRKKATQAAAGSVLPLIRHGKVALLPKTVSSPFERTDVSSRSEPEIGPATVYPVQISSGGTELLPLVCIEALRLQSIKSPYEIVGLVSYDARPSQFQPFIEQQVRNRKVVFYCNDGRYGGSRIGAVTDDRSPSWLAETFPHGLPAGDAILVVDADLDTTAVEVATAAPRGSLQLVVLTSIVGEHSPAFVISRTLHEISELPAGAARAERVARLRESQAAQPLQKQRVGYLAELERRGVPSTQWWAALGQDCIIGGHEDLRGLEARLSAACRDSLTGLISTEAARRADVAQLFMGFFAECSKRAGALQQSSPIEATTDVAAVIDRDGETRSVLEFLDRRAAVLLEVSGLPQIGKSAVIDKALTQSGISSILRLQLTSTSSPDYLLYTVLKRGAGYPQPPYADPVEVVRSTSFSNALSSVRIIVFERAHLLMAGGGWRDDRLQAVLEELVNAAQETGVKLIFETQRELPIELSNPSVRQRLRVPGLQKHLRPFGEALFDAQLRRVGLAPDAVSDITKGAIVERLGGHPVAIALAADASYDEGGDAVLKALKERRGFYLSFLERLLRPLSITDEDQTILRLLTLARVPVDRGVVLGAVTFPAGPVLRNLIALGTVDVGRDGRVEIAGVLREYFDPKELAPDVRDAFHRAAAAAFEAAARQNSDDLESAVEAEYHAGVVGVRLSIASQLLDGALATAQEHFRSQRYEAAASIVEVILRKQRSLDTLRLAAQIAARRNQSSRALQYAREVLLRDPKDTRLLTDLVKISLTQYQDDTTATRLIELARSAGVEDVSVLVVEGRLYLRQHQMHEAERVLRRAVQLTRFNPWPYYYLGITYQRLGRLDEAINVLEDGQEFFYRSEARSRNALNAIRTQLGLAYLFADDIDGAARVLDPLFEEDPSSPEVVRAYAALTIKRDGIQMAERAFARLNEAKIRNRFDRCQFHLFYGLFQLGIDNPHEASKEFAKAHAADRSNVYVMMKWARTLYDIARAHYLEQEDVYKAYVSDCGHLVRKILEFDPDNHEGVELMNSLYQTFGFTVGGEESPSITGR